MNRVCPLLGLAGDRRSAIDGYDSAHRCHAEPPPLPIERGWQARYCLTAEHPQCERYQQAMARRGAAVSGRAAIADGLVSTRMLLAPEPPWRGMAGRARRAGPRRAAAVGAALLVGGASTAAVVGVATGGIGLGGIAGLAEASGVFATPTPTQSPTPTPPSPTPLATSTPTPTLEPTATPPPETPVPATPTPAPTPVPTPRTYVVQEGDTLGSIAQAFGTTVEAIQAANGIEDPDSIQIGDVLVIP